MKLYADFEEKVIDTENGSVFLRIGGQGKPLVMLHGYPQTHACWHRIAPQLAEHFTVILPDVRGYGQSCLPAHDPTFYNCSKRASAKDIVDAMAQLGYSKFHLVGHDRGARVGYRLALDFPDKLHSFVSLDVVPTIDTWAGFDAAVSIEAYHWPFLAQPFPLPEKLIAADPIYYLEHTLASWTKTRDLTSFDSMALDAYRQAFASAEAIHAYCNDYRAGSSYDLEADKKSRAAGEKIQCPLLVLWGAGPFHQLDSDDSEAEMIAIWRDWCDDVRGEKLDSGHFLAEENPVATLDSLLAFYSDIDR